MNVKLVVVGDGGVGKTCLLIRYTSNEFPQSYVPTVFDNYHKQMTVENKAVYLGFWDTAGQEDYDRLRPLSYPQTDIFLICFSLISPSSLRNVTVKWSPEIKANSPDEDPKIMLVGTKYDLKNQEKPESADEDYRVLDPAECKTAAANIGALEYIECSALSGYNVEKVFDVAVQIVLHPEKYTKVQAPPAAKKGGGEKQGGGGCCVLS